MELVIGTPDNHPLADGDVAVGSARVFRRVDSAWRQLGGNIEGEGNVVRFGLSVAMSDDGDTVVIGAPGFDSAGPGLGVVRIFRWDGGNWEQLGLDLEGDEVSDRFGWSVAASADGNIVAIGAPSNNGTTNTLIPGNNAFNEGFIGQVRVFEWDGSSWGQLGNDIEGEGFVQQAGYSVSPGRRRADHCRRLPVQ